MPDTLSREELAAIRARDRISREKGPYAEEPWEGKGSMSADRHALLLRYDEITAAVKDLPWNPEGYDPAASRIEHEEWLVGSFRAAVLALLERP